MNQRLSSRTGRLVTFFFLYITEGIPFGLITVALITQMRAKGVEPGAIGEFMSLLYIPWAMKWALGPIVDVFSSTRWGRRRMWIVLAQGMMVLTLLSTNTLDLAEQVRLMSWFLLIHNLFAAIQDIAIDALAVTVLEENERGLANGIMFGAFSVGSALGGPGVLWLLDYMAFETTYLVMSAGILCVTVFVVLPLREPAGPERPAGDGNRVHVIAQEILRFTETSFRSLLASRGSFAGLFLALLPMGAMALGSIVNSVLPVDLGLSHSEIAELKLHTSIAMGAACVCGGLLSDRFGRRRMLAIYIVLTIIPGLVLAWAMARHESLSPQLVTWLWPCSVYYSCFNGFMFGTRLALFMDVTNPVVAGAQFTAYAALLNVVSAYTTRWQGVAITELGYVKTLVLDAALGLLCLVLIPFMKPGQATGSDHALTRARFLATLLAVGLAWHVPYLRWESAGLVGTLAGMFLTIALVFAGVFLISLTAMLRSRMAALLAIIAFASCFDGPHQYSSPAVAIGLLWLGWSREMKIVTLGTGPP